MKRILSALTLTTLFLGITAFAVNSTDRTVKPNLDLEGNSSIKRVKEIEVKQLATGTTASVGYGNIYFKTNGLPYFKDSNGMETPLVASVGINEWQDYSSHFSSNIQGWSSLSSVDVEYRRVGDSVHVRGRFTAGGSSAVEARLPLPSGLTVDSTKNASIRQVGLFDRDISSTAGARLSAEPSVAYLVVTSPSTAGFDDKQNGSFYGANTFSFDATVPVTGWTSVGSPGAVLNEWQDFSAAVSFSGLGTTSTETVMGRRVGDSLQLVGYVLGGTPAASTFSIDLTGYTIDTTKCPVNHKAGAGIHALNGGDFFASSGWSTVPFCDGSDNNSIFAGYQASGNNLAKINGSDMISANKAIVFDITVPISGWSGGFTSAGGATYIGTVDFGAAANCSWSVNSATFSNFSADTDCNAGTASGNVTAPGTKIPAVVLNVTSTADRYVFIAKGQFRLGSAAACAYRFSDGTNSSLQQLGDISGRSYMIEGGITFGSTGSKTVQIQASYLDSSAGDCRLDANADYSHVSIDVYRYPAGTP